jgi:hypothetical protein
MARRRIFEQPASRLAVWALRIALFSLAATVIAVIIVRSGALDIVPALSTLAVALVLAVVSILLALASGVVIWREGIGGVRQALAALLIGFVPISYPLYIGIKVYYYKLPAIYDVTTDPIDPPQFEAIARLRSRDAHSVIYAGLYAAEQQRKAYSDIEPDDTTATPQEAYNAAMKVIGKRKWKVVDARPPQEEISPRLANARTPQSERMRDGLIEAIAFTPILSFRDDVVVRVRATPDGARIDVRSASRYGSHDLGANAERVRALIGDIDDVLSRPAPEKKPMPQPAQAAGKGSSVKR